ncbi:MAG: glycine zipper 2TM domain-containing protein [Rhodanobacter sp.]
MHTAAGKLAIAAVFSGALALTGCVSQPYGNSGRNDGGYSRSGNYGNASARCANCGVVQEVQQVYTDSDSGNGGTLGAIIGAVAGGVLGSTIGKGDGRTAATVGGAVAGGVVGNQVGKHSDGGGTAWRVVVRRDDGQYVTVTQRENPGVRNGDYVEISNGRVYAR